MGRNPSFILRLANENLKELMKQYEFVTKNLTADILRTFFATRYTIIYKTPHFRRYLLQQNKLTERLDTNIIRSELFGLYFMVVWGFTLSVKKSTLCQ
jgi:hypothetical protein